MHKYTRNKSSQPFEEKTSARNTLGDVIEHENNVNNGVKSNILLVNEM